MAADKYISINGNGDLAETSANNLSATPDDIVALDASGTINPVQMPGGTPVSTSAGAGDSGKLIKLDGAGKIDASILPAGIGSDALSFQVGVDVTAGDFVNIYDDAGTAKCRPADNTTPLSAHGYVTQGALTGASVTVYFEGVNTQLTGLVAGTTYFLDVNGDVDTYANISKTTGDIAQKIGVALSTTSISFEYTNPVIFA